MNIVRPNLQVLDESVNLHNYLEEENEILKSTLLEDLKHLIFYGKRGIGKYYQTLLFIKKFSPSKLKYNKKMYIENEYYIKVSDVHFEIDMATLGCNCKIIWGKIQKQITNSMESLNISKSIILCKNFHDINKDLLHNFKNTMLKNCCYIFLTEHVCFIPTNIIHISEIICLKNITKKVFKQHFKTFNNNRGNLLAFHDKRINEFHGIEYIDQKYINIIINYLEKSKTSFSYLTLREHIYNLLIYQCNIENCIWHLINFYIRRYSNIHIDKIIIETYNFLIRYNSNYRPIFHLEYIILFIFNNVNICK